MGWQQTDDKALSEPMIMMTSSNGNIFCITGPLRGESTSHRWIPLTKASDAELWCFSLICAWTNDEANNWETGDLGRHHTHYHVTVMMGTNAYMPLCIKVMVLYSYSISTWSPLCLQMFWHLMVLGHQHTQYWLQIYKYIFCKFFLGYKRS